MHVVNASWFGQCRHSSTWWHVVHPSFVKSPHLHLDLKPVRHPIQELVELQNDADIYLQYLWQHSYHKQNILVMNYLPYGLHRVSLCMMFLQWHINLQYQFHCFHQPRHRHRYNAQQGRLESFPW